MTISDDVVESFRADGAVLLKGVFADWVETLRSGVERNLAEPGPNQRVYTPKDSTGRFVGDYCNWARIPEYREFVFPHTRSIVTKIKSSFPEIPFIHYANGAPALVDQFASLGADVVGLDWRTDLAAVFQAHPRQVFQGNLDPCYLFAPPEKIAARVKEMKTIIGNRPHIWNLGHGILPETPVENARAFVKAVHENS